LQLKRDSGGEKEIGYRPEVAENIKVKASDHFVVKMIKKN
jgi:hypothetical protein